MSTCWLYSKLLLDALVSTGSEMCMFVHILQHWRQPLFTKYISVTAGHLKPA